MLRLVSHPSLLEKATKTAFVLHPEYGGDLPYQWLSSSGALVFDTIKTGANPQGTALYRVNVVTGIKMRLTELESRLPSDSSLPYYAHVSPDGKRLLVFKGSAYQVVELDGSRSRQWQDKKGTGVADSYSRVCTFWLEDSRHIVHFLSSGAESVPCLLMRSVDAPAETQHVPLPATPEFQARDYFSPPRITPGGMVFAFASAYEENDTRTLLLIPPALPRVKIKTTLHAPPGTTFVTVPERHGMALAMSPNGTRVAWLCKVPPHVSPLPAWLRRLLPGLKSTPTCPMRLYISHPDGSQAREIGSADVGLNGVSWQSNGTGLRKAWILDPAEEIFDLRWLPGGRCLSFVRQHTLYTVSAEE